MRQRLPYDSMQDDRARVRARARRRWSRRLTVLLVGLCLMAIWQERRLAPPLHDGMQTLAGLALERIERNDHLAEALVKVRKTYAQFTEDG